MIDLLYIVIGIIVGYITAPIFFSFLDKIGRWWRN